MGPRLSVVIHRILSAPSLLPLFTTVLVSACAETPSTAAWSVVDSAGVSVVENHTPAWGDGEVWTVDPTPLLDLTETGSGEAHEFFQVADVARFGDGRIVVADRGSHVIRVFDPEGRFLLQFGGEGDGPGEFRQLAQVWALGADTVLSFDGSGRLNWFLDTGEMVRDVRLGRPGAAPWGQLARFEDGVFVGTTGWSSAQLDPSARGLLRLESPVLLVDPATTSIDTLLTLPGPEVFRVGEARRTIMGAPPLGKYLILRAFGSQILAGAGDGLSYDLWDRRGTLAQRVRVPAFDLSGAAALGDSITKDQLATMSDPQTRQRIEEAMRGVPVPAERPGYSNLLVDPDGNVWAAEHRGPIFMYPPERWEVFSSEGRWLGSVATPSRFNVHRIASTWIAGNYLDGLDVHHVRVHRLVKPELR